MPEPHVLVGLLARHEICTADKDKYMTWLCRVQGRFDKKIAETLSRGKTPNLRNFGHLYRDSEPEVVFRMACLWNWLLPHIKASQTESRVQSLMDMFHSGALDKDLYDKCKVPDAMRRVSIFNAVHSVRFQKMRCVKGTHN